MLGRRHGTLWDEMAVLSGFSEALGPTRELGYAYLSHIASNLRKMYPASRRPTAHKAMDSVFAAGLGVFLSAGMAIAQSDGIPPTGPIAFDIPAQPLAPALDAYSAATGIVAVYNGNLAVGRQSGRVRGRYSPDLALRLLLSDSGLVAQYTARTAFVLVPAPAEAVVVKTPSTIALAALARQNAGEQRYSGLVQSGINQVLCAGPETRPGDYRLAMRFRIGPSGEITNLKLLSSTGDRQRDAAVIGTLRGASVGESPPSSMAQPFTMIMLPRSSGGVVDCPATEGSRQNG